MKKKNAVKAALICCGIAAVGYIVKKVHDIGNVPCGKALPTQGLASPAEALRIRRKLVRPGVCPFQQIPVEGPSEVSHGLPFAADAPVLPAVADQIQHRHHLSVTVGIHPEIRHQLFHISRVPPDPVLPGKHGYI